uniref:Uncharacterized protein n=1 Tax=Oryza brachyantha TaxID=4533 RepID=J3L0C1_ORYBR
MATCCALRLMDRQTMVGRGADPSTEQLGRLARSHGRGGRLAPPEPKACEALRDPPELACLPSIALCDSRENPCSPL